MSINFADVMPQNTKRLSRGNLYSHDAAKNLINSMDTAYGLSANILFHERRDDLVVSDYSTDDKSGFYPWYNNTDSELGANLWDCRVYRMPYFPPTPGPGDSDKDAITINSKLYIRAKARGARITVLVRRIADISADFTLSLDASPASTDLACVGTTAFETLTAPVTLPIPFNLNTDIGFSIEIYWAPLWDDLTGGVPAWLSQLTLVEYTPNGFPS